jgi:hypothetical protein
MYQRRIGSFSRKIYKNYTVQIFLSKRSGSGTIVPDPQYWLWGIIPGQGRSSVVSTKLRKSSYWPSLGGPLLPSMQSHSPLCVVVGVWALRSWSESVEGIKFEEALTFLLSCHRRTLLTSPLVPLSV